MALHTNLSIITLNLNDFNAPMKRHKVAEWMRKQDTHTHISIYLSIDISSPRDPLQIERYSQTKSKWMEKDISFKWKGKKGRVAVLISDKTDFKTKALGLPAKAEA